MINDDAFYAGLRVGIVLGMIATLVSIGIAVFIVFGLA